MLKSKIAKQQARPTLWGTKGLAQKARYALCFWGYSRHEEQSCKAILPSKLEHKPLGQALGKQVHA